MDAIKTDDIIQQLLRDKCEALETKLNGEVILIRAPMAPSIEDVVRREIENVASKQGCRDQLIVVLENCGS